MFCLASETGCGVSGALKWLMPNSVSPGVFIVATLAGKERRGFLLA